jgi:hypothetical protein
MLSSGNKHMMTLNKIAVGNGWKWICRAFNIPKNKYMHYPKYTLFNLQGHIFLLQGHKVSKKTRYFNACR